MRPNRLIGRNIACLALMLAGLGACGSDEGEIRSVRQPTPEELEAVQREAQPIIEEELAKEDARSATQFPCTLFDQVAASNLLKAEVEAPMFAHEFKKSNDIDTGESDGWQADACTWSNWGGGASLNVWVSKPEDFEDHRVHCFGIYPEDVTETLLGGTAKWVFQESFRWAKLLVCRDDGLFFVEINDGPVDESAAKRLSTEVASRIAEAL